jgi:hypothetical protein
MGTVPYDAQLLIPVILNLFQDPLRGPVFAWVREQPVRQVTLALPDPVWRRNGC